MYFKWKSVSLSLTFNPEGIKSFFCYSSFVCFDVEVIITGGVNACTESPIQYLRWNIGFFLEKKYLEPKPTPLILQNDLKQMVHKIAQTNKINKQAYNTIDAIIQTKRVYFAIQVLTHSTWDNNWYISAMSPFTLKIDRLFTTVRNFIKSRRSGYSWSDNLGVSVDWELSWYLGEWRNKNANML